MALLPSNNPLITCLLPYNTGNDANALVANGYADQSPVIE
jgi:hypothetical protein